MPVQILIMFLSTTYIHILIHSHVTYASHCAAYNLAIYLWLCVLVLVNLIKVHFGAIHQRVSWASVCACACVFVSVCHNGQTLK